MKPRRSEKRRASGGMTGGLARRSGYDKTSLAGEAETVMDATSSCVPKKRHGRRCAAMPPSAVPVAVVLGRGSTLPTPMALPVTHQHFPRFVCGQILIARTTRGRHFPWPMFASLSGSIRHDFELVQAGGAWRIMQPSFRAKAHRACRFSSTRRIVHGFAFQIGGSCTVENTERTLVWNPCGIWRRGFDSRTFCVIP